MRRLILGTAGHIDHGKTTLVHALTGIDTDRLPEEKRRGITIDLGFARLDLGGGLEFGIVDVPGHEAFVRNMLAGATGVDVAMLVIAADEGIMPQTREHLAIVRLLDVRTLVVALTKADLADDEWRALVEDDVASILADGPYADAPIVPVSARTGQGLDELRAALKDAAERTAGRPEEDFFRMPVDRVFTVRGTGTVVTGTIWSGSVDRDRVLRILPDDVGARIRAIHSHGEEQTRAIAGQRAALALAGIDRATIERGCVLVDANGWTPASILTTTLSLLEGAPAMRAGQRIRFHLGTTEALGRVVPFDPGPIEPGSVVNVQMRLERPVVARAGDRFVLRSYSPVTTIAGGTVLEPFTHKRKRPPPEVRQLLDAIGKGTPEASIEAATRLAGWAGIPLSQLPIRSLASPATAETAVHRADAGAAVIGSVAFHRSRIEQAALLMLNALDHHHDASPLDTGLSRETLRQTVPAAAAGLAEWTLQNLAQEGAIILEGSVARRSGFETRLDKGQARIAARLEALFETAGLASPLTSELPADLAGHPDLDALLRHLVRTGTLVQLAPGRFASSDAITAAVRRLRAEFGGRADLSPGDFRDLFGISRKYLIPLLEHLDRTGVTRRAGESRQVETLGTA